VKLSFFFFFAFYLPANRVLQPPRLQEDAKPHLEAAVGHVPMQTSKRE